MKFILFISILFSNSFIKGNDLDPGVGSLLDSAVYYNLQFDFSAAGDLLNKVIEESSDQDTVILAKFYLAHTALWTFKHERAEKLINEINIYSDNNTNEISSRISLINPISRAHKREFLPALLQLKDVLKNYEQDHSKSHPDWEIWKPYLAFLYHFSQSDIEESEKLYYRYIADFNQHFPEIVNTSRALSVLQSLLYYYQDDRELAIGLLNSLRSECPENKYCKKFLLAFIYRCLSYFSLEDDNVKKAREYAYQGLAESNTPYNEAKNLEMLGLCHVHEENYDQGDKILKKAFKLFSSFNVQEELVNHLENYVRVLATKSRYDIIIDLEKIIDDLPEQKYHSSYGGNTYIPNLLLGYYIDKKNYPKALSYLNKSMSRTLQNIDSIEGWEAPPTSKVPVHTTLAWLYFHKSKLAFLTYKDNTDQVHLLKKSLQFALQADTINNLLHQKMINPKTTKRNLSGLSSIYNMFVDVAFKNYELQSDGPNLSALLHFINRTQDVDLALSLLANDIRVKDKEFNSLSVTMDSLQRVLNKTNVEDTVYLQRLINKIEIKQKQILSATDSELKYYTTNERYFDNHVTYHKTVDNLIIIESYQGNNNCKVISNTHDLDSIIIIYQNMLSSPYVSIEKKIEDELYSNLIEPLEFVNAKSPMSVSATGNIGRLPLEPLWYSNDGFIPALSYTYTYTNKKGSKNKKGVDLTIIKPDFKRDTIGESEILEYGDFEASSIEEILNGPIDIYRNLSATSENLETSLNNSKIVHLITHAFQDEENPQYSHIKLSNNNGEIEKKYSHEFSTIQGNAELVVLSACETGIGKYSSGVGIQSFAKTFMAAGNKSVLSTLWQVNDRSTAMIMANFYKHLVSGKTKEIALQKAKMDYLIDIDPEYRDPYYWSGFILTGDMSSIEFSSLRREQRWLLPMGLFMTLFISGMIYKFYVKPS